MSAPAFRSEMSYDEAIALSETKWWLNATHRQIAEFQMAEDRLCCPFSVFHEAVEKSLGRPVFTHEFGLDRDGLWAELMGERPAPGLSEIINLIPADKQVLFVKVDGATK